MKRWATGRSCLPPLDNHVWLLPILLFAACLRLARIGYNSIWFDEAFSWIISQQSIASILTVTPPPIMPPGYDILLHLWTRLGTNQTTLRLFSALSSLGALIPLYAAGRRLFGVQTALAAAVLMALAPFQIYFAQEARMYALVIFLAAITLWLFVRAWESQALTPWLWLGIVIALGFYCHYFIVFFAAVLTGFTILKGIRNRRRLAGMGLAGLLALVLTVPQLPSAMAKTTQVATNFWLAQPTVLQPVVTLDFLLFGHTTPVWAVPVALFATLAILAVIVLMIRRADRERRPWLWLLLSLSFVPMVCVLVISRLIGPTYLDRSFSVVTPAYMLLLGWAIAHARWRSPMPFLFLILAGLVILSLSNHYAYPDPAKPPFRQAAEAVNADAKPGDVILHLHCSSYLPFEYYRPEVDSYLLADDPRSWLPQSTWTWAGRQVSSLSELTGGRQRLWVVTMPKRLDDRQEKMFAAIDAQLGFQGLRRWDHWDPIEVRLYDIVSESERRQDETP